MTSFSRSGRRAIASPSTSRISVCVERRRGLERVRVLERVDERHRVARRSSVDQSSSSATIDEREISSERVLELFLGHARASPAISSSVGARMSCASSCAIARSISRARDAHRARHPVQRAQLVDDRALDPRDRVRLELDVAVGVVPLDRVDQPEQAVGDEVALVDVRGQAAASRPATYLTSGAYVRISRSRSCRSGSDLYCTPEGLNVFDLRHGLKDTTL